MKKVLLTMTILLLLAMSLVGCSTKTSNKEVDIIDYEVLSTTSFGGSIEVLTTIQNNTENTVDNYSVEILSKDKKEFITGMSFNEMIDPNGTVKVPVVLPNGLTYDDVVLNISDYNFQK